MEITQLTTTRVAPIDFTVNAVAELRISKLRDSDEDFSLQVCFEEPTYSSIMKR